MTIGNKIAQYRKQLNITQDALAQQLEVTNQAVSKWESDQCCPDISLLPRLADIFNISIDELFDRAPKAQPQAQIIDGLPWPDDKNLRAVAYVGHKLQDFTLARKGVTIRFRGDVSGVLAHMCVQCGNVSGNVDATGSVTCEAVGGDVDAGTSVSCGKVLGHVNAGSSITCQDVEGNVDAGDSVRCANVAGSVDAGTDVTCGDVGEGVDAGCNVTCGSVGGDVDAGSGVKCERVEGSVDAGGNVTCSSVGGDIDAGGSVTIKK